MRSGYPQKVGATAEGREGPPRAHKVGTIEHGAGGLEGHGQLDHQAKLVRTGAQGPPTLGGSGTLGTEARDSTGERKGQPIAPKHLADMTEIRTFCSLSCLSAALPTVPYASTLSCWSHQKLVPVAAAKSSALSRLVAPATPS